MQFYTKIGEIFADIKKMKTIPWQKKFRYLIIKPLRFSGPCVWNDVNNADIRDVKMLKSFHYH